MNTDLIKHACLNTNLNAEYHFAACFEFYKNPQDPAFQDYTEDGAIGFDVRNNCLGFLHRRSVAQLKASIEKGAAWAGLTESSQINEIFRLFREKHGAIMNPDDKGDFDAKRWAIVEPKLRQLEKMNFQITPEACPEKDTGTVTLASLEAILDKNATEANQLNFKAKTGIDLPGPDVK